LKRVMKIIGIQPLIEAMKAQAEAGKVRTAEFPLPLLRWRRSQALEHPSCPAFSHGLGP
jgi:hypothetical protein